MTRRIACGLLALALLGAAGAARADHAGAHRRRGGVQAATGEAVYRQICQGCHMPDGRGAVGAGRYPAFAGDPTLVSASYVAATVLLGRRDMPSFAERAEADGEAFFGRTTLTDAQVAAVVNYVRTHFGNHYPDAIGEAEVRALRQGSP